MAIFQAFFDESGKFNDKHVISFCGLCSPPQKIRDFDDEWKALLRHYGLASLTMKRALRRKIPFSKIEPAKSVEERNAVLGRFAECIRKHFELGVAMTVDADAYRKWPARAKKRIGGSDNPHYLAFMCGAGACTKYILEDDRLNLVCDDEQATAINCYKIYQRMRVLAPEIKKKFVAITFADDDEFTPLQAADMLASLCRQEAARQFRQEYYECMPVFQMLTAPCPSMKWGVRFYGEDWLHYFDEKWQKIPRA